MTLNVFISYAKENQTIAENYYSWLEKEGFSPWLDIKKLKGGQNWELEIDRALQKANVVMLLMSSTSVSKRGFVQREVKDALDNLRYKRPEDIYIIPIKIEQCDVPDYISNKIQFIDNINNENFEHIKNSLLLAAEQQAISVDIGTMFGPYLIQNKEIRESWDDNLGYDIDISYPSFNDGVNKKSLSELNSFFSGRAIKQLIELRQEKLEQYDNIAEWHADLKNEYSEGFGIAFASKNLLSLSFDAYLYFSGAAHGNFGFQTFNFDTRDSLIKLRLEHLFRCDTNYLERISDLSIKKLCQEYWERTGENASEEDMEWFKEGASPNANNFENFLITENGIIFLFPPYQVSSYVMGKWSIEIPYFELRDLLKDGVPKMYFD
ncbi:TIR domain-containing protein [Haemophilus parainfluenzae]|uniref:TIR domain-containing protein n=1 Tax=Haemophilus parainfluenzae TaxID=729 RepID=UPI0018772A72|nr:TIR domain-containing protein [Haemophilus parainfluenzae]MBE4910815.1 TIR domain-containing protein [Haemophilus parainfluenzae]